MMTGLPPVWFADPSYYRRLLSKSPSIIALRHNIKKQQGLNRMIIPMADGPKSLSIPLVSASLGGSIEQITISFKEDWPTQHWRTIQTAYQKAPYFAFYAPDVLPLFQSPSTHFLDQSRRHLDLIMKWLRMSKDLVQYLYLNSGKEDYSAEATPFYHQVFSDALSFTPSVSILDLFFNVGPEAALYVFPDSEFPPSSYPTNNC